MESESQKSTNILIAPAHYYLDDMSGGSEYSWVANILHGLIKTERYALTIITGFVKYFSCTKSDIVCIKKEYGASVLDALIFVLKNYLAAGNIIKSKQFRIIHHMLPFLMGVTFDLNFLLRSKKKYKFILGPVQSPHTVKSNEEFSFSQQGFNINYSQKLIAKANTLLIFLLRPFLQYLSKKTLQRADKIIVINEYMKTLLESYLADSKIEVIPLGIDIKKFEYVDYYSKDRDVIQLITVGYLIKRKGIDLIIRALSEVVKSKKNILLRIIGDGPQRESLEKLTKELGIEKYVLFQGFVPNNKIQNYYARSHIFVNMSKSEGFATVCLEAMASGLSIISSKVGGFSDAIVDGITGFLVEQEDYMELVNKMLHLIENPDLIATFGRKARKDAEDKYDWRKVIIPKYIEIYESCLEYERCF